MATDERVQDPITGYLGHFGKWVILSALIGVLGGLAAVVFKGMIELAREHLFVRFTGVTGEGLEPGASGWIWVLIIPTLGGALVGWLIHTWAPETEGHGTDSVIRAYHRMKGVVRKRVIALKALTAALTIGTGGSAGQEGPVAQVGAGIGSSISSALGLSDRDRRLFLLSGASAGIGAMFCSPLGGALFAPEVLYKREDIEGDALVPCIIASIFAYATYAAISGVHRVVEIPADVEQYLHFSDPKQLLVYLVLGVACTGAGWLYTRVFYGVDRLAGGMKQIPKVLRPALGGLLLGLTALIIAPMATGGGIFFGGYGLIESAISGELALSALVILVLAKILATSFTISSGGSGGVFAPALAIGALLGAAVGQCAHELMPGLVEHAGPFALVGMGGFFAGVAKVPIASVVMVSEMTGSYDLLAPLMLVAVVHLMLSRGWTMYRAQVTRQIDSPAHVGEFVIDVLQSMKVRDVLEDIRPPRLIHEDVTLRGAMKIVADSHETHFPVVDDEEQLVGIFSLTDLRRIFLEEEVGDFVIVRDFMSDQVMTVTLEDSLHDVQRLMTRRGVSAIPVVDTEGGRQVLALLERNSIGHAYAEELKRLKMGTGSK
jgi:CIC family chloride channel protein